MKHFLTPSLIAASALSFAAAGCSAETTVAEANDAPETSAANETSANKGGGDKSLQKVLADPAPQGAVPLNVETIAEGLVNPWCIAFLPGGDMLVTERAGRVRIIRDGMLLDEPVANTPTPLVWNQSGYFDILPHPDFEENQTVFFSYAHGTKKENALRVVKATFDGAAFNNIETLYEAKPLKDTGHHYGAKLVIGGDEKLYISIGEGSRYKEKAQDMTSSFGAIVRLNQDGSIPDDNPDFGEGALPELYSKGHRNPQGLAYDSQTDISFGSMSMALAAATRSIRSRLASITDGRSRLTALIITVHGSHRSQNMTAQNNPSNIGRLQSPLPASPSIAAICSLNGRGIFWSAPWQVRRFIASISKMARPWEKNAISPMQQNVFGMFALDRTALFM